jgi:hypothetical protein
MEWVETGEFGLASGARPDGGYTRVWYDQLVAPGDVMFDADVYLLKKAVAAALHARFDPDLASSVELIGDLLPTPIRAPASPAAPASFEAAHPGPVRIVIEGDLPPEQWNRLGTRLIPKLRAAGQVGAAITLCCEVDATMAADLISELERTLLDLGLANQLKIGRA